MNQRKALKKKMTKKKQRKVKRNLLQNLKTSLWLLKENLLTRVETLWLKIRQRLK